MTRRIVFRLLFHNENRMEVVCSSVMMALSSERLNDPLTNHPVCKLCQKIEFGG